MTKVSAGAAGSQLKRAGNYVAPIVTAQADRLAASNRQDKQLRADKQARDEERLDKAYSEIKVEDLVTTATGQTTRDDVARNYASVATQRSMEYAEKAREAASKGDWTTMNNYKGRINRIKGDFKNTVNDEVMLKEMMDNYKKKWRDKEIDDPEWLDFAESLEKFNYTITLDENDNKVITAVELDDDGKPVLDENGEPKVMTKKWSDLVNQNDRPYEVVRLEDKEGKKGLIGDLLSTMGKRKYDEQTGDFITTTQEWDETAENQFKAKLNGLFSSDRMMYSLLNQATGGNNKKKKGFTEEDKKLVEDFLRFQVKGGYGEESSLKVTPQTQTQRESEAAKNRAVTMRGQDAANQRAKEANEIALKKLALEEWKAKNGDKEPKTAEEKKKVQDKALVVKFFDVAKRIGSLGAKANDDEVQEVLDESGLGFVLDTDWQLWFEDNQFDLGVTDIKNKDAFNIVKGMAKKAGLKMEDTDIRSALVELTNNPPEKGEEKSEVSDEEAAAKAKALLDKYSKP